MQNTKESIIYKRCNGMDSASWISMLELTADYQKIGDMEFPGFPSEDIQINMISVAGRAAIASIAPFYSQLFKAIEPLRQC